MSSSEDNMIQQKLSQNFDIVHAAGAGYKILSVVLGFSDAYIYSKVKILLLRNEFKFH